MSILHRLLGAVGRVGLVGHPIACTCPTCTELDGDAAGLVALLEQSAAQAHAPLPAPPPQPAARAAGGDIIDAEIIDEKPAPAPKRRRAPRPAPQRQLGAGTPKRRR